MLRLNSILIATVLIGATSAFAQAQQAVGEIKGSAWQHTPTSLADAVANGALVLPAATGRSVYEGKFKDAPAVTGRFPVVIFLHGSSGLGLKAIGEWQRWLASLGVASVAPDSFTLPDRITYNVAGRQGNLRENPRPARIRDCGHTHRAAEAAVGRSKPDRTGRHQRGFCRRREICRQRVRRPNRLLVELRAKLFRCRAKERLRGRQAGPERHQLGRSILLAGELLARESRRQRTLRGRAQGQQEGNHRAHPWRSAYPH